MHRTRWNRNPLATLLPVAALCGAVLVPGPGARADQGCEYALDDGRMEWDLAFIVEGATLVANQFEVDGCTRIEAIRYRFGGDIVGMAYRALIYDDPTDDGNLADATLVSQTSGTVAYSGGAFQDIALGTPAVVSGQFYAVIVLDTVPWRNTMIADRSNFDEGLPSPDLSFYVLLNDYDDPNPLVADGGAVPLFENVGTGGYWMIRAIGNDPAGNNDEAANAFAVGVVSRAITNVGATNSAGAFQCGGGSRDVWYVLNSPGRGELSITACGNFSPVLEVHDGTTPGTVLACAANGCTGVALDVESGEALLIRVGSSNNTAGTGTLNITFAPEVPANDQCDDAQDLVVASGGSVSVLGSSVNSTFDLGPINAENYASVEAACGALTQMDAPGVWYRVIGTGNEMTATICNPGTDWPGGPEYPAFYVGPRISVYCNCPPPAEDTCDVGSTQTCLFAVCVDGQQGPNAGCAQGGEVPSTLPTATWCTQPGVPYYILVFGDENAVADFELSVDDDGVDCDGAPNCVVDNSNCLFPEDIAPGQTVMRNICNTPEGILPLDLCGNFDSPTASSARWYQAVGDNTTWTVSLCSGTTFDSGLAIYTGTCSNLECAPGFFVIPDNCGFKPQEMIEFEAEFGVIYLIRVWVNFGACGNFTLSITSDGSDISPYTCNDPPPVTPANNCCSAPTVVAGPFPVSLAFNTGSATTDGIDPDPANPCASAAPPGSTLPPDAQIHNDVWYSVTATETGDMTVSICEQATVIHDEDPQDKTGPDGLFDSKLAVYDVTGVPVNQRCTETGLLTNIVGCNEDCSDVTSEITVPVVQNRIYYVRLGGFDTDGIVGGETGSGMIDFSFGGAPTPCPADTDGNGVVNVTDLTNVILAWGTANPAADVNNDGIVNVGDLTAVILAWGNCPP